MKKTMAFAAIVLLSFSVVAQAGTIKNWAAPSTWTPPAAQSTGGRTALIATTYPPLPFIPVTPCRVVDTRAGSGFASGYGPPSLVAGGQRSFTITSQCGIPAGAQAVSFNFAVWAPTTRGDLRVFPTGAATPTVSTLNWEAGILALANAAVAPLGSGAITVQLDSTTPVDIFIDVNGYYSQSPASAPNTFVINAGTYNAAAFHTTGGGEAVDAYCDTVSVNCWAMAGTTGVGNFGGVFHSGRGLYSSSTDTGYAAFTGSASLDNGGTFSTGLTSGFNGGVVGSSPSGPTDNYWGIAGVRGIGANFGVLGISTSFGTGGFQMTSGGALNSGSYIGFSSTMGLYTVGTTGASGVKSFIEPHPTDATKVIRYVALEGPEAGTYFRGKGSFVGGRAVIAVPEDFRLVTDTEGLTVQITPFGGHASVAVISVDLNEIVVESNRDVQFYYHVNGVRQTFKDFKPMEDANIYYMPDTPTSVMPGAYSAAQKQRLIDNGTYNPDGTPNLATAQRVGWAKIWQQRADEAKAAAAAAIKAAQSQGPTK